MSGLVVTAANFGLTSSSPQECAGSSQRTLDTLIATVKRQDGLEPAADDFAARDTTSYYRNRTTGILYVHVDNSFVHAFTLTADAVKPRIGI